MNPLSIQLYTVRELFAENAAGTLETLADIGFTRVEPFGLVEHAQSLADHLSQTGLKAPTAHAHLVGSDTDAVFRAASHLGVETVIDPMIDPARWTSRESVEGIAQELKTVAEQAADYGIRIGYHNHAFELESTVDGVTALEVFAAATDGVIDLELDTYWAAVGGAEAPALLTTLGEQVKAVHIKDGPKTRENKDQVAVGGGQMPISEIIGAAGNALVVVELDDFAGNILDAVGDSYSYLTSEGLVGGEA